MKDSMIFETCFMFYRGDNPVITLDKAIELCKRELLRKLMELDILNSKTTLSFQIDDKFSVECNCRVVHVVMYCTMESNQLILSGNKQ